MYDGPKIIAGLIVFLVLALFPFWYTAASGQGGVRPDPKLPEGKTACVASKEYMNPYHMDMLDDWRDLVVRDGHRMVATRDGEKVEMSLTKTCMDCHANKETFCDECHTYLGVDPYCWDCHIEPKGE
ncbi:MAG: sulfate reduction electron transfer complex DsrMKJOP subunit DsrJ [Myxococcota bacterium]|nr:sulfate reduction electron transfer complex DsrMKJOP subunit DsrJ [Myxococcota bacterium]